MRLSAEAITDAKVLVIKRSALATLAERDAATARGLYALTARELQRAQDHIMLLVKSAQERVASFLLEMAERERLTTPSSCRCHARTSPTISA